MQGAAEVSHALRPTDMVKKASRVAAFVRAAMRGAGFGIQFPN